MANNVQYMNGKSLGIGAFLPSTVGERFNAVQRSNEEHEAAVNLMAERFNRGLDLFTGELLESNQDYIDGMQDSEENDEIELDD